VAGPIPPNALLMLLGCGSVLPIAALMAAVPDKKGKWKILNVVSFLLGLTAIAGVAIILYRITTNQF